MRNKRQLFELMPVTQLVTQTICNYNKEYCASSLLEQIFRKRKIKDVYAQSDRKSDMTPVPTYLSMRFPVRWLPI